MARTTKDRPDWVRDNTVDGWIRTEHSCSPDRRDCDEHVELTATNKHRFCNRIYADVREDHLRWYDRASREMRHEFYWRPERAHVRHGLRQLARNARYADDVDDAGTDLTDQHTRGPYPHGYWH